MSSYKGRICENLTTFKLLGLQMNLTPRTSTRNDRPNSATPLWSSQSEQNVKCKRPRSAENSRLKPHHCKKIGNSFTSENNNLAVSQFTNSSSKLLQNLLQTSTKKDSSIDISSSEASFTKSDDNKLEHPNANIFQKFKENNKISYESNKKMSDVTEDKTVRFLVNNHCFASETTTQNRECICFDEWENNCSCTKNKSKLPCFEDETFAKNFSQKKREKSVDEDSRKNYYMLCEENLCSNFEFLKKKEFDENVILQNENKNLEEEMSFIRSGRTADSLDRTYARSFESNEIKGISTENDSGELSDSSGEPKEVSKQIKNYMDNTYTSEFGKETESKLPESTYEEIVDLLRTLDEDDSENLNSDALKGIDAVKDVKEVETEKKTDYQSVVSTFLEDLVKEDSSDENVSTLKKRSDFMSPRLEELLNKNSVELAHEVFSLKIQLEDQKKGIKLLRDTLGEMRKAKKVEEIEHQEALNKVTSDADILVQRHQKFIKQLLNEKKNLNETVSKLVQDLKTGEDKYKKNIKAIEEKHLIEIKRAKQAQAVADKIRREKWMENKTQKIKEMTVKGLEPELSRMAARQQEEMTELRNLHKAELEALELRAARRNSELMDELRAELTKEKERAIAKETSSLRAILEKNFEEEKNKLLRYCESLKDRIRKQEEKLSNQEFDFQQRILELKQEEEKKKQKIIRDHEENLEELRRQQLIEIKNLKEHMETEKEAMMNNLKKQQASEYLQREAELHQQYKRERDREIEMVIETLEKESAQTQSELNLANEGKLKRLKEKMEVEIKEIEESEVAAKLKLSELKTKLTEKEDVITELNSQIRRLQTELTFFKKSFEEMNSEKAKMREIIREEFENIIKHLEKEKENLEKNIVAVKEQHSKELAKKDQINLQNKFEMQKELAKVYNRIKTAVNKKEKIIESLREENNAINQKCLQLEFMLDQQRKNLLL